MTHYPLRPTEVARLCEGTQAAKHGWTEQRRAEVVVDGEIIHEHAADAEPFDLWEAVRATR